MQIILGNSSLIKYFPGGGHWSWFLQYVAAFKAAGHRILWLELLRSSGDRLQDLRTIRAFYDRLRNYDADFNSAVLLFNRELDFQPLQDAEVFGLERYELHRWIRDAELLLNFACALRQPLLSQFKKRALLDVDPGHLQMSGSGAALDLHYHDVFLTIGSRINAPDSIIPKLGHEWRVFDQLIYLPLWDEAPLPSPSRPFTSITQWTWEQLHHQGRVLSVSKRDAYLRYLNLPKFVNRPMELAANIGSTDPADDARSLREHGWRIVDPHQVVYSPETYRDYIAASRGEFMCPKPIHVELKTGWFSDRSLAYLASGRPVVAEETGFSERVPTGTGLLSFNDIDSAAVAIAEIDANYERHRRAAREIVEAYFDWRKTVDTILVACA